MLNSDNSLWEGFLWLWRGGGVCVFFLPLGGGSNNMLLSIAASILCKIFKILLPVFQNRKFCVSDSQ